MPNNNLDYEHNLYHNRRQSMPNEIDMGSNKYMQRINNINNQIKLADALDSIKTNIMTKGNPNYPSTISININNHA